MDATQTNPPKTQEQIEQELQQLLADAHRAEAALDTFHNDVRKNTARIEAESAAADQKIDQICDELDKIEIDTEAELDTLMMQFVDDLETNP